MKILSIDLGTYSVKFIISNWERRLLVHEKIEEIELPQTVGRPIEDLQMEAVHKYLKKNPFDGKKIVQIPAKYLTSRFIKIPVSSKKKAEAIAAYQLDRELPFSIQESLFSAQYIPYKKMMYCVASIIELKKFDPFFKKLELLEILPDYLTSELSTYQSLVQKKQLDGPFCIMDIGHDTSKAYVFYNQKLVSGHISYVAGKSITDNIAESYRITKDEAKEFKHQNSFFLTDQQFEQVDPDQREFAKLMKEVMMPLINDFRKWELGYRVNYGENIQHLYLCGGTSNIKNICNFFTQHTGIKTELLDPYDAINLQKLPLSIQDKLKFHTAHLMGSTLSSKFPPNNFRTGIYAPTGADDLPLHSGTFIGVRLVAIILILFVSLFIERIFLFSKGRMLDQKNTTIIKKEQLHISRADQRRYKTHPHIIQKALVEFNQKNEKEIKVIKDGINLDALAPFVTLNKMLAPNPHWSMLSFENSGQEIVMNFKYEDLSALSIIKETVRHFPQGEVKLLENSEQKMITVEIKGVVQ